MLSNPTRTLLLCRHAAASQTYQLACQTAAAGHYLDQQEPIACLPQGLQRVALCRASTPPFATLCCCTVLLCLHCCTAPLRCTRKYGQPQSPPSRATIVRFLIRIAAVTCTEYPDANALGCTLLNPSEEVRTYSSVLGDDAPGSGNARSMLDSARAWLPGSSGAPHWTTIDAGSLIQVRGVVTQGQSDDNNWVSAYQVLTSANNSGDESYSAVQANGSGEETFTGNADRDTHVSNLFAAAVHARYVRIVVVSHSGNNIAMRAGLVECGDWSETTATATGCRDACRASTECALFTWCDSPNNPWHLACIMMTHAEAAAGGKIARSSWAAGPGYVSGKCVNSCDTDNSSCLDLGHQAAHLPGDTVRRLGCGVAALGHCINHGDISQQCSSQSGCETDGEVCSADQPCKLVCDQAGSGFHLSGTGNEIAVQTVLCTAGICGGGGTCDPNMPTPNTFTCTCASGYTGGGEQTGCAIDCTAVASTVYCNNCDAYDSSNTLASCVSNSGAGVCNSSNQCSSCVDAFAAGVTDPLTSQWLALGWYWDSSVCVACATQGACCTMHGTACTTTTQQLVCTVAADGCHLEAGDGVADKCQLQPDCIEHTLLCAVGNPRWRECDAPSGDGSFIRGALLTRTI